MLTRTLPTTFALLFALACAEKEAAPTEAKTEAKNEEKTEEKVAEPVAPAAAGQGVLTMAELTKDLDAHAGKQIRLQGLVSHVCRRSGKKLFIVGVEQGQNLKVVATDAIAKFDVAFEGTNVVVEGKLVKLPAADDDDHDEAEEGCTAKQLAGFVLECVKVESAG